MRRMMQTAAGCACLLWAIPAFAGTWVVFANETATRMPTGAGLNDPLLSTTDPDEKDYAWGDVDQDGDIDLIVVRKQPFTTTGRRRNVLFMNEGIAEGHAVNGVLIDRTSLFAPDLRDATNDRDVGLADLDGDGWLDIITSTTLSGFAPGTPKSISHPRIYINLGEDGAGNWLGFDFDNVNRVPTMATEPRFCAVATGDVDCDGDIDLYFADYDQGPYGRPIDLNDRLWINNGLGFFTDESVSRLPFSLRESSFGTSAIIADMNGDNRPDIGKDSGLAHVETNIGYMNAAACGSVNTVDTVYTGNGYFIQSGDLNNDGRLDLVMVDDGRDSYLLNLGNVGGLPNSAALFQEIELPPSTNGFGGNTVIADLDGDGFNDVLIADVDPDISGCTRRMHIFRNLGNVPTVTMSEEATGIPDAMLTGTHDVAVFDVDGDCWLDLVIGRCSGTQVWINQAPGTACPVVCPTDVNGDGTTNVLDLIALLLCFGQPANAPCDTGQDINADGTINVLDLIDLLLAFGSACP